MKVYDETNCRTTREANIDSAEIKRQKSVGDKRNGSLQLEFSWGEMWKPQRQGILRIDFMSASNNAKSFVP